MLFWIFLIITIIIAARVSYVESRLNWRTDWATIITAIAIIVLIGWGFIAVFQKMTDRICNKPYSKEFKQTQQYKDMQCSN